MASMSDPCHGQGWMPPWVFPQDFSCSWQHWWLLNTCYEMGSGPEDVETAQNLQTHTHTRLRSMELTMTSVVLANFKGAFCLRMTDVSLVITKWSNRLVGRAHYTCVVIVVLIFKSTCKSCMLTANLCLLSIWLGHIGTTRSVRCVTLCSVGEWYDAFLANQSLCVLGMIFQLHKPSAGANDP